MGASFRPVVVAVCGSPAAGKTAIAREISASLRIPLIARDELAIGLGLGSSGDVSPDEIRSAAEAALIAASERLARSGVSFVVESSVLDASHLSGPARLGARVLVVHVSASPEVIGQRLRERIAAGNTAIQRLLDEHDNGTMRPELFAPWGAADAVVRVDTSSGPAACEVAPLLIDAVRAMLG